MCWKSKEIKIIPKIDSKIDSVFICLSFLLDQKVPKNQGSITMLAFLSQRYLLAIQLHGKVQQILTVYLAVYCYAHAIRTYLRLRNAGAFL